MDAESAATGYTVIPLLFFWILALAASFYLFGQEKAKIRRNLFNQIEMASRDPENPNQGISSADPEVFGTGPPALRPITPPTQQGPSE